MPNGNAYIIGFFQSSTITFGTESLTNSASGAGYDIFVVKYDSDGDVVWARSGGGLGNDQCNGIAIDMTGSIYITGYFQSSSITFNTNSIINTGYIDLFIVKYDFSGDVKWAIGAGGTGLIPDEQGNAICTDNNGDVYITGFCSDSSITFGSTTLINGGPLNQNVFIAKYDSSGTALWATNAGDADDDYGSCIKTDSNGDIYLGGIFKSDDITFGSTTLPNTTTNSKSDAFLVKYNSSGDVIWAKSATGSDDEYIVGVETDESNNVYVTGFFNSTNTTFSTETINNEGGFDIVLVKYNSQGAIIWAKGVGGGDGDYSRCIINDNDDYTYIAGNFKSTSLLFNTTLLTNVGEDDFFIAKLDNSTGLEDLETDNMIEIYPNPVNGILNLELFEPMQNTELKMQNLEGQMVYESVAHDQQSTVNVSGFADGIYLLTLQNEEQNTTVKVVVQH